MTYVLTNEERETQLLTHAAADLIEISTADPVFIRRFEKLADEFPEIYVRGEVTKWGEHAYTMPKRLLRFGKPASEAQKEAGRIKAKALERARQLTKSSGLQQSP